MELTFGRVLLYRSERPPQELFAAMPPMVAREAVETSTGNHSPCGFSWRFNSSSTMPGCTTHVFAAASSEMILFRCFEQSITTEWLTVWPHWDEPPPRASTLTPSLRATA